MFHTYIMKLYWHFGCKLYKGKSLIKNLFNLKSFKLFIIYVDTEHLSAKAPTIVMYIQYSISNNEICIQYKLQFIPLIRIIKYNIINSRESWAGEYSSEIDLTWGVQTLKPHELYSI